MAGMEKVTETSVPEIGPSFASVSFTRKVLTPLREDQVSVVSFCLCL